MINDTKTHAHTLTLTVWLIVARTLAHSRRQLLKCSTQTKGYQARMTSNGTRNTHAPHPLLSSPLLFSALAFAHSCPPVYLKN